MRLHLKLTIATAALALALAPAALAGNGHGNGPKGPEYAPEAPQGKAYGYYCKGQSKEHVKGEKGTAFSRCVQAMARADHNEGLTAREACKTLSKKHVKGQQGTPFSRCVKGVAQLRKEAAQS